MQAVTQRLICSQAALMRMGKEHGIPTPYNEFAYHIIKAMEEKNDGKFDYTGKQEETTCAK